MAADLSRTRALWRDGRARFGTAVIGAIILAALFAPLITPAEPSQIDVVTSRFLAPITTDGAGAFHLLGTDRFGRDVWTRLAYGARVSLAVGLLAMAISVLLGLLVGSVAGVFQRRTGGTLMGLTDFALALPRVVLLLLLTTLWQPGATLVVLVLGLTGWMSIARLVYGETRGIVVRPFVESAYALGANRGRVLLQHVMPNSLTPVIAAAALGVGNTIMLEAGLSFLGLGVQPPTPSWGNMIASGRDTLVNAPWVAAAPGIALVLVVVGFTLLGDAVQEKLMRK